jgi:hypothetical protein
METIAFLLLIGVSTILVLQLHGWHHSKATDLGINSQIRQMVLEWKQVLSLLLVCILSKLYLIIAITFTIFPRTANGSGAYQ